MLLAYFAPGLLLGIVMILFPLRAQRSHAQAETVRERERADNHDRERQRVELDLAALRPEANRTAQLNIEVLKLASESAGFESRCAALAAVAQERERTVLELRQDIDRLTAKSNADGATILTLSEEKATQAASLAEREASLR